MLTPWLSLKLRGEEKYLQAPVVDPENARNSSFLLQSQNHPGTVPAQLLQPQSLGLSQPRPGHCLGSGSLLVFYNQLGLLLSSCGSRGPSYPAFPVAQVLQPFLPNIPGAGLKSHSLAFPIRWYAAPHAATTRPGACLSTLIIPSLNMWGFFLNYMYKLIFL